MFVTLSKRSLQSEVSERSREAACPEQAKRAEGSRSSTTQQSRVWLASFKSGGEPTFGRLRKNSTHDGRGRMDRRSRLARAFGFERARLQAAP